MDSYFNPRDEAYQKFTRERQTLWNRIAAKEVKKVRWSSYYHRRLNATYRSIIPAKSTVLEVGCGRGDLLAFLELTCYDCFIPIDINLLIVKLFDLRSIDLTKVNM